MHRIASRIAGLTVALALTAAASGCVTVSARAHGGVVFDEVGSDVQTGLSLGLGMMTSQRGAVVNSVGVTTGLPHLGLNDHFEYIRMPEPGASIGGPPVGLLWRAGFGTLFGLTPADQSVIGTLHAATTAVVVDRLRRQRSGFNRLLLGVGLEGRAGLVSRDQRDDPASLGHDGLGGQVSVTVELMHMSWWQL